MLKYRNVSGKDPLKRLLLGIVVLILSMIAAVSTACNEEDISASRPTVTPAPAYETIAPTSYSTPNPTPTATSTPASTPTPTSTPTPSPTPASIPAPTPILPVEKPAEILIRENVGYATDDGIAVRASPTSSSQLLGTLKYREEVKILGQVEGESWIPSSREWAGKWFKLKDGGFVYFTFIHVPKEGEASPFVSGEKKVEVDRGKKMLYAFIDGNLVYQAPVGIGQPWTPTPLGEFNVWTKVVNETMSGADYSVSQVLYTQYFENGYALHFNWWSPIDAFGNYPTSHGCVSLRLHDAQWMWFFGFSEMSVQIYE